MDSSFAPGSVDDRAFGSACVLAGGRGRRLEGGDKLSITLGGERLLARVERQLRRVFCDIVAATGRPEAFIGLGYRTVPDALPGLGPLAGLLSGLRAARSRWVYLTACDMPFFDEAWARHLMGRARALEGSGRRTLAIAARSGAFHEPFHALYHVDLAEHIERSLLGAIDTEAPCDRANRKAPSLQSIAREVPFEFVDLEGTNEAAAAARATLPRSIEGSALFWNVNTLPDLQRLEAFGSLWAFDRIEATGAY